MTKCAKMTDAELKAHMSVMACTPGKYAARQFRNALDEMIRREETK